MAEVRSKTVTNLNDMISDINDDDLNGDLVRKLGELAAGVVHEVRNPLQTVRAFIQAMGRLSQSDNKLNSYIPLIIEELNRADMLLEDFLHFTHQKPLKLAIEDIVKICQETVVLMQSGAYLRGQTIIEDYEEDLPLIKVDGNRIRQILLNLLLNALDAGKDGDEIILKVAREDNHIYLKVIDRGAGLTDEEKVHIFDAFYTTKQHGTGLGLPLCLSIAKVHGGDILVESELDKGSSFSLILPI